MALLDAAPDKSPICVHLRRRAVFIYSLASLFSSTAVLLAGANASAGLCRHARGLNWAGCREDGGSSGSIETAFAAVLLPPLSRIANLVKNRFPAIRAGLLMVFGGGGAGKLDLEKERWGGDNVIETVGKWVTAESLGSQRPEETKKGAKLRSETQIWRLNAASAPFT